MAVVSQSLQLEWKIIDDTSWNAELPKEVDGIGEAYSVIGNALQDMRQKGHLTASLENIEKSDSLWIISLFKGSAFLWAKVDFSEIPERWMNASGLRKEFLESQTISRESLLELYSALIEVAEQNGYPFASVRMDNIRIEGEGIHATMKLNRGPMVFFDGVESLGEVNIADYYLASYLDVKPGTPYDLRTVLNLKSRLEELPFLELTSDPIIRFTEDRAVVQLQVKNVNASRIDFVIGFLPRSTDDRRLLITGNVTGEFYNQLGLGERLFLDFERLRPQTQELELAFTYPYLLDLPFGLDVRAEFSRQDSLFLDLSFHGGIEYIFNGSSRLRLFLDNKSSRLLDIDENAIKSQRMLPAQLDFQRTGVGLSYQITQLDFRLNPTRGWNFQTDISFGRRRIEKNDRILDLSDEEVNFNALYDSLALRSTTINIRMDAAKYFRISSLMTVKVGLKSALLLNNEDILVNELYRIGGNKLMRGFDEESIFASTYAISTLEYRLLTGRRSYFFSFFDLGFIENNSPPADGFTDWLTGFGAGITFDTAAGIFSLSAAIGGQEGSPVDFRRTKIHFGFVSLF